MKESTETERERERESTGRNGIMAKDSNEETSVV